MLYDSHVQSSITNTEDRRAYFEMPPIVLIDNRVLVRDCLAECLRASHGVRNVLVFDTVEQWQQAAAGNPNASVIVVAVGGRTYTKTIIERDLHNLCTSHTQMPIVVISDVEDFDCVTRAVQCGAKGYVPTSFDLKVTIGVIELVKAGEPSSQSARSRLPSSRSPARKTRGRWLPAPCSPASLQGRWLL